MAYASEKWLAIFNQPCGEGQPWDSTSEGIGVLRYRMRTIRAGDQVELEAFPVWETAAEVRKARAAMSREAQINQNAKNAKRRFERKMNATFTEDDYRVDLTYSESELPDAEQAKLDVKNYLRRVQYECSKRKLPSPKYMGVSEGKREGSKQTRLHHHIVISCGLSRDVLESKWELGRVRTDRLQPDSRGFTALARYMLKEPIGSKRYFCSRNLKEPKTTESNTRLSIRRANLIAEDVLENGPAIFAKLFPNCEFVECEVKRSSFVAGAYIYARLRRTDDKWESRKGRAG